MPEQLVPMRRLSGVMSVLIAAAASLLLLPKLVAIEFTAGTLGQRIGGRHTVYLLLQDGFIALTVYLALNFFVLHRRWRKFCFALLLTGLVLLLLLLDLRVREIWLKPSDLSLVKYGLSNADDLGSGTGLFFDGAALGGLSFGGLCAWVGALFVVLCLSMIATARQMRGKAPPHPVFRRQFAVPIAVVPCLLVSSVFTPGAIYHLDTNFLVSPFVNLLKSRPGKFAPHQIAQRTDQPVRLLSEALSGTRYAPSRDQQAALPNSHFRNVLIVFFESVRWSDVNLDKGDGPTPALLRMAQDGAYGKAYVSVPHSSKSYFSVITGRHPHLGIEMREGRQKYLPSIMRELNAQRSMATFAFSSMPLDFENVDAMLRAAGVNVQVETAKLLPASGQQARVRSSFGADDEPLYRLAAEELSRRGGNFAALLFPLAAHYPYNCPGRTNNSPDHDGYDNCLRHSDKLLRGMLVEFRKHRLLEGTLVVVVGDHGEAFGEHGVYAHNATLYEEEVSVPLVFWSDDGSVKWGRLPDCRQIDIAPTIADILDMAGTLPVQGSSALRMSRPPAVYLSTFFDESALALLEIPTKYVYDVSSERLTSFDLRTDPLERHGTEVVDAQLRGSVVARLAAHRAYQAEAFPD